MSHSDSANLAEFVCWAIAILCSTAALALAMHAPHPAAVAHSARKRKKRRDDGPSLYQPMLPIRRAS